MLIASGADIKSSDSAGWMPLHYAAFNGNAAMVEMLLNRGASPHATTNDGNTALHLGFRGPGLTTNHEDKEYIWGILQGAMNATKKSKLRSLTDLMNSGTNKSREAGERNKIWHTAELAAALYQTSHLEDGEAEEDVQLTPSASNQVRLEDDNYRADEAPEMQQSSGRLTKRATD